jgi:hypothetical protein
MALFKATEKQTISEDNSFLNYTEICKLGKKLKHKWASASNPNEDRYGGGDGSYHRQLSCLTTCYIYLQFLFVFVFIYTFISEIPWMMATIIYTQSMG